MLRPVFLRLAAAAALALAAAAAPAQISTIDPNSAVDPAPPAQSAEPGWEGYDPANTPVDDVVISPAPEPYVPIEAVPPDDPAAAPTGTASQRASKDAKGETVPMKRVLGAAEGVFGKGAEGLADLIEDVLRERGDPTGYITGREAGGAFIAGVRYGSGTLYHGIEGDRKVYWTGPSVGFDFGANADKVFVLVYNLHDSERLFRRFPAGEGKAYVVGGFTASYLRRGDIVLIPVRLGVGARLGVNAGYMRFSQKNRWLPF
ncbi:MAG TPA: EipA family protein [Allosphingosinicella sp.]|nr:EipA family protein [Allosphingosinicella sp.]